MPRFISCLSLLLLLSAGCRTTKEVLADYDRNIAAGNYAIAAREVGELAEKGDDSVVLWRLQTAGAKYLADDKDGAIRMFDLVEDAFLERDGASAVANVGQTSLAMMTNERSLPYAATGSDRIFTCFYKSVDFASLGNFQGARTELNRAAQHQDNWLFERRKEIADKREQLDKEALAYAKKEKSSTDVSKAAGAADNAASDSAFAAKILNETGYDPVNGGNIDSIAQNDYFNFYVDEVMRTFREIEDGKYADQVFVYVEDGLCPIRTEWRVDLPFIFIPYARRYIQYAGMALPKLVYRGAAHNSYTISAGAPEQRLELVQDVDLLLKTEYDVYMSGCLKREITRTIVKAGVQVGLGVAAQTTNTSDAKLAFRIAQLGAATWAATTTAADLRTWTTLPKKVYRARVTRPADGKILVHADGGPLAEINLPPGNSMIFIRKPTASAPAVVKTVTFPK